MQNYPQIIEVKYPGAKSPDNFEINWQPDPALVQSGTFDELGRFIPPDNSNVPLIPVLTLWALPDPPPTFEELDAYAESPEYLGAVLDRTRAIASGEVNEQANIEVVRQGILTDQLFFVANISDIGLLITAWIAAGRPTELDPVQYYRAYREAAAYAETSDPTMTAYKMLQVWEVQWNWMRHSFADLNYHRRKALEQIKLVGSPEAVQAIPGSLTWE